MLSSLERLLIAAAMVPMDSLHRIEVPARTGQRASTWRSISRINDARAPVGSGRTGLQRMSCGRAPVREGVALFVP